MQISRLKVFQSVKIGNVEKTFLTDAEFSMELKDNLVFITRLSDGSKVITPLTNTPWFIEKAPEEKPIEPTKPFKPYTGPQEVKAKPSTPKKKPKANKKPKGASSRQKD